MQRLGAGHRHEALLVRPPEQNGNPHYFVPLLRHTGMHRSHRPGISFYIILRFRVRAIQVVADFDKKHCRTPLHPGSIGAARNDYAGTPTRFISQCSSIPEFSLTRARTVSPRTSISWPVAPPVLIRKLQCISETCAPPTRRPRQPAASISFQALRPGGFLKVEPPVFSRIGCAVSRWICTSVILVRIASGEAMRPRNRAAVKMIDVSTPLLR